MSTGTQRFAWLSPKERTKRNARWLEFPREIRIRFRHEVALRIRALGERRATEFGWEIAMRLDSWRRRAGDSKPCSGCRKPVLWRVEHKQPVPVDPSGHVHACGDKPE